jgi:hypothetical protein
VNAFFLWELNSCETIVKDGRVHPIDYANACPDLSIISLHYYFPWVIKTLAKWTIFCTLTGRKMRIDQATSDYFRIGDDAALDYEGKLEAYAMMAGDHFESDRYREFCDRNLGHVDEVMVELVRSEEFDRMIVETVTSAFPPHEHEGFIAHYRGLLGAWADDQERAGRAPASP